MTVTLSEITTGSAYFNFQKTVNDNSNNSFFELCEEFNILALCFGVSVSSTVLCDCLFLMCDTDSENKIKHESINWESNGKFN